MNRFIFILKNTICSLKEKMGFNLIIIIALSIGLFMPMLFLAQGNYYLNYCSHSFYTEADGTAFIDGQRKYMPVDELNEKISKIEGVTDFAYYASCDVTVEKGKSSFISRMVGISEHYTELTGYTLIEGRIPTDEEIRNDENVCIVRRNSSEYTDGWIIKVGDEFKLNGKEYTVIGIILDPKAYGEFLIPYSALEKMVRPNAGLQYVMFLRTIPENVENVLNEAVSTKLVSNVLQKLSAAEHEAEWRNQLWIALKKVLLPELVLLALSVLNFILIMYGKFLETLYAWGVKMAVGEARLMIFIELFLQNLILILLAVMVPVIIVAKVLPELTLTDMLINEIWLLGVLVLCIILSLIITSVLYFALIRKKIPDMLRIG